MSRSRQITLGLVLAGLGLSALAGDLWLWHGPLRRCLAGNRPGASPVVARVFDTPITRSQLDRAVCERLWFEGRSSNSLAPADLATVRRAALEELIDHELLRVKATANASRLTVSAAEINGRCERFRARFETQDSMAAAMKSQGIGSERDLRARLAARIQQEKYVESRIAPLAHVTEVEARQWFEANRRHLANPERVEARHVFLPTLDHPPAEAQAELAAALTELAAGTKDFATLASEISEDPATRGRGGCLGWMTRDRLPADFATPVFALALNQPALVRTHLGWHLVEVTARQPAAPRSFEQAKPEILAALEAVKRRDFTTAFRAALRRFAAAHIEIGPE